MKHRATWIVGLVVGLGAVSSPGQGKQPQPFEIQVVDDQTGRGVPLVELRTVNQIRYYTDSNGIVAFDEPGLMGRNVFFYVSSHGYEFPKDGFGFRGRRVRVTPGGRAVLRIHRRNIAERLYRVTGAGIYADSVRVGRPVPISHPLLNANVAGSDSVVNAVFRGRIYWFWGDTNFPSYPLGNFHVPGATSLLPGQGGLDPDRGVALKYFRRPDGAAKETARMPGPGPTWINALTVLRDHDRERLFAVYVKVRRHLQIYERGLVEFDPEKERFRPVRTFPRDAPIHPAGHPFLHRVGGVEYVYFATPYPLVRVRADVAHFTNPDAYEAFTCQRPGQEGARPQVDHDDEGRIRYAWRKRVAPIRPKSQRQLQSERLIGTKDRLLQLRDIETGREVIAHSGSVYWNDYRRRWVMIAVESGGKASFLGEVWYAEADTPVGPWLFARKVVTHDRYSFYNPKQHPMFAKESGRFIYFEGTYSRTFSGNPAPTPRYDYNQIMYKLDLADDRLALPVPVYRLVRSGVETLRTGPGLTGIREIAFFAPDRPFAGAAAWAWSEGGGNRRLRRVGNNEKALFYAVPPNATDPPKGTVPLYEFVHKDGRYVIYDTNPNRTGPDYRRSSDPICLVWSNPFAFPFDLSQ